MRWTTLFHGCDRSVPSQQDSAVPRRVDPCWLEKFDARPIGLLVGAAQPFGEFRPCSGDLRGVAPCSRGCKPCSGRLSHGAGMRLYRQSHYRARIIQQKGHLDRAAATARSCAAFQRQCIVPRVSGEFHRCAKHFGRIEPATSAHVIRPEWRSGPLIWPCAWRLRAQSRRPVHAAPKSTSTVPRWPHSGMDRFVIR